MVLHKDYRKGSYRRVRYTTETPATENRQQYTSYTIKLMKHGQRQKGQKPTEPQGKTNRVNRDKIRDQKII